MLIIFLLYVPHRYFFDVNFGKLEESSRTTLPVRRSCLWRHNHFTRDKGRVAYHPSPVDDYKNLPRLCTGTGKSIRVSKICSQRRGLPSRGRYKSLTRGWFSLSLYKIVVDYFSPTALNPHNKTPLFALKTTSKRFLFRKRRQLGLIMTLRHCMIYDVTRSSLKRSCLSRGR